MTSIVSERPLGIDKCINQRVTEWALQQVIPLEYVLSKVKQLMDAVEHEVHYDQVLCKWQISPPLASLNIQLKATDMALRLLGAYPSEKHDLKHSMAPELEKKLTRALRGVVLEGLTEEQLNEFAELVVSRWLKKYEPETYQELLADGQIPESDQ